jgi:uroporphyrinogen decarboxylase
MNSKEIVKRALQFKYPQRIPLYFESPQFKKYTDVIDSYNLGRYQGETSLPMWGIENKLGESIDEWGCVWKAIRENDLGYVVNSPLQDLKNIKGYKFPDPNSDERFEGIFSVRDPDKYMLFVLIGTLFERLYWIHGMEETLMDISINTKEINKLIDIILEYQLAIIGNLYSKGIPIDGIELGDDWGSQESLFVSPHLWRKTFKNRYRKIIDFCHKCNYDVWFHCDGKINEIMDDFVEIGVDAINLYSPDLLGIEEIGKKYKEKITFFSSIDHQYTLGNGGEGEIRSDIERVVKSWGSEKGGLILYFADLNAAGMGISNERQKMIVDIISQYTDAYGKQDFK